MQWLQIIVIFVIIQLFYIIICLYLAYQKTQADVIIGDTVNDTVPPGITNRCFQDLPNLEFSGKCGKFTKEDFLKIMYNPNGVCLFDVDGTLSVEPVFDRNQAVLHCLENNFAVGVITAGGYKNAKYFCHDLQLNQYLPCLCDFFSINKGVTFFQNQPLVSDEYCYSSCQGNCMNDCLKIKSTMIEEKNYNADKHTIAKTCALDQVHKMYPHLEKKCISLIDNEHSWTCYSREGEGCAGFGGQWSPYGVTQVDVTNLISHCKN
jgi:hypothetical protein